MEQRSLAVVAALLLGAAAAAPEAAMTRIRFAPAEGLALRKRFEKRTQQELDWVRVTIGDEERDQDQTQASASSSLLVVVDRYAAVGDERVRRLERHYEDFEGLQTTALEVEGVQRTLETETSCELVGHAVRFTWADDAAAYVASSDDEELEAGWLEGLGFELDFLALLPADEVEVGDEWPVDAQAFRELVRFERGLPLEVEPAAEEPGEDEPAPEPEESVSGALTARFVGTREEEGLALAVIELAGIYRVRVETESVLEDEGVPRRSRMSQTTRVELLGELRWNLSAGHFHAGGFEAASVTDSAGEMRVELPDRTLEVLQKSSATGTVRFSARFEPAE